MNRDWNDFKSLHGNISGARQAFEDACETLFRKKHKDEYVSQVRVKQGDGGIDIFIGEIGIEPIIVIQCKFFLESFGDSQKSQIRESFKTAINSPKYKLKQWILCIPRVFDIDESLWWSNWKDKKNATYSKNNSFIQLTNGNALIDLFKEYELYNQIFKIDDSQKINEIHAALIPQEKETLKISDPSYVLFNNYTNKNEPFYFERSVDSEFIDSLKINNIWIFGLSGSGKTALINRNLIQQNSEYCYCDMSPITITSSDDVFVEILSTVEDVFEIEKETDEPNVIKQISKILNKNGSRKTVIVIDELSVHCNELLKKIAEKLIQLVIYFNHLTTQQNLKFVISTISNPKNIISNKPKAGEHFQYICSNDWGESLEKLFDLLCIELNLDVKTSKEIIIENSQNSPRVLKCILKKIFVHKDTSKTSVQKAINKTLEEIVE